MTLHRGKPWTPMSVAMLVLMFVTTAWMFLDPLRDMLNVALRDAEQSHILLAVPVALWLLWLRRSRLSLIGVRPSLLGTGMVAAGCLLTWFGFRNDVFVAWHGGAVLALIGTLISVTGLEPLRSFGAAFGALVFVIPVPGSIRQMIAIPLQSVATSVTHSSLELFGFQAAKLGNVLIINGEQIAVAEACNGMRLVFALTLVVYAFVFSSPLRPGTRVLMILISPIIAVLANVIRLVPTSLLYGSTSADQAVMFHDLAGWAMLPIALLALIGVLRLLRWLEFPVTTFRLAGS